MVHGMARSLVWISATLSARAVCALRPTAGGIENGAGGEKDEVVSSASLYISEEKGRYIVISTLLTLVTVGVDL